MQGDKGKGERETEARKRNRGKADKLQKRNESERPKSEQGKKVRGRINNYQGETEEGRASWRQTTGPASTALAGIPSDT